MGWSVTEGIDELLVERGILVFGLSLITVMVLWKKSGFVCSDQPPSPQKKSQKKVLDFYTNTLVQIDFTSITVKLMLVFLFSVRIELCEFLKEIIILINFQNAKLTKWLMHSMHGNGCLASSFWQGRKPQHMWCHVTEPDTKDRVVLLSQKNCI